MRRDTIGSNNKGIVSITKGRKAICTILAVLMMAQYGLAMPAFAANGDPQPAPERLRVEAVGDEPPIGYNEFDKHYVDLKSDKLATPDGVSSYRAYLNYYLQEVNKPYKPSKPVVLAERNIPASTVNDNEIRLKNLNSGTVYYAYSRAYYTYSGDMVTYTSNESSQSNTVKFMTDIAIDAYSYGPNQIKIEWDDVWNSGKRMDYRLYVSENRNFSNSPAIYIGSEQISQNGPVTVNDASGKLEYIHTVRDPGRVYYIKIVPDTTEVELKRSGESRTVVVSSYILAKTTKMSVTDEGAIWKLEWSPVVTGLADSSVKVLYQIYRGTGSAGSIEQYMASVDDTTFFLTLQPGEEDYYYIIKAIVTSNGQDLYPGIRIQSQRIYVKESEVPSTPAVPELVPEFSNAAQTIISYEEELRPNSATILWKAPLKGDGEVDTAISYDIWLINDPNMLEEPPEATKIASSIRMNESNFVMSGTRLLGYKYTVEDLVPNSTYYFKIVAKKDFVEFVDSQLSNVTLQSDPAMKIIITPTLGPINQPLVPAKPPFALKRDSEGKDLVTTTSAIVTLKNKWYEQLIDTAGGAKKWIYRTPAAIDSAGAAFDPPITASDVEMEESWVDPLQFRKVEYDIGVTIDLGCIEYTPDLDYSNLDNLPADRIIGFPVTPNDPNEDITDPDSVLDNLRHNIDITIRDLEPNKTYVVWVRAARRSVDLVSGPSDPIIITTLPDLPVTIEKPTVPVFNYDHAADTYIDLGWNVNSQYVYYLEYGTEDNRSRASGNVVITPDMLEFTTYYRVDGLEPDTVYYFWLQAEATNAAGDKKRSDFTDSYIVKTAKDIPPPTPMGFGVRGTAGSITKNSITYEWIAEEGMQYILEIDDGIDYSQSTKYEINNASEFTVENLRSNFRYYARLYAFDPAKGLASEPTQSAIVRTLRSSDDYDSSEDVEDVISGDYIIRDNVSVNGVWTVQITGVNADRFVQHVQTDKVLDYNIDLRKMPTGTKKIVVKISQRVFRSLGILGENLLLTTQRNILIIRPGVLADNRGVYGMTQREANFIFEIVLDSTSAGKKDNLTFKTPISELDIGISDGITTPMKSLQKPLKVIYEYSEASWYKHGTTAGYVLPKGESEWKKSISTGSFSPDESIGRLTFETFMPGRMAIADLGKDFFDDISGNYARNSISNVASAHKLKSVIGRKFEPLRNLTIGEGVKFMLDIMDINYGSDYMSLAAKSGIIQNSEISSYSAECSREKLIAMAMRACELKTSQKARPTGDETVVYKDIGQVSPTLLSKVRFAKEIGVITSRFSDTLGPKDIVTRAESMVLIEKLLRYAGEI
jgi:hypothetical protein